MGKTSDSNCLPKTKPTPKLPCDTDRGAIASRLETLYKNLHVSNPKEVKKINELRGMDHTWTPVLDANNNNGQHGAPGAPAKSEVLKQKQTKIKYELPQDYQGIKKCICLRPARAYECGSCHQYFQGRLSQICEKHPSELFLMDYSQCPYCFAQLEMIKEASLSWEAIRKIEEADLPSDTDL